MKSSETLRRVGDGRWEGAVERTAPLVVKRTARLFGRDDGRWEGAVCGQHPLKSRETLRRVDDGRGGEADEPSRRCRCPC